MGPWWDTSSPAMEETPGWSPFSPPEKRGSPSTQTKLLVPRCLLTLKKNSHKTGVVNRVPSSTYLFTFLCIHPRKVYKSFATSSSTTSTNMDVRALRLLVCETDPSGRSPFCGRMGYPRVRTEDFLLRGSTKSTCQLFTR